MVATLLGSYLGDFSILYIYIYIYIYTHTCNTYILKGNDNPIQYSCLGNPMDRGAWQATVYEVINELDMA